MALFESYERRIDKINSVLAQYGISSVEECRDICKAAGFDPYERKLLGITAMTTLLGRKKFEKLLGGLTCKPEGKPVLVPETDKRQELHTAADDFADPI